MMATGDLGWELDRWSTCDAGPRLIHRVSIAQLLRVACPQLLDCENYSCFTTFTIMTKVPDSRTTTLTPADTTLTGKDVSSSAMPASSTPSECVIKLDIEHALVEDDPRIWSNTRKVSFLLNQAVWLTPIN
jgi:hypothetical protein